MIYCGMILPRFADDFGLVAHWISLQRQDAKGHPTAPRRPDFCRKHCWEHRSMVGMEISLCIDTPVHQVRFSHVEMLRLWERFYICYGNSR